MDYFDDEGDGAFDFPVDDELDPVEVHGQLVAGHSLVVRDVKGELHCAELASAWPLARVWRTAIGRPWRVTEPSASALRPEVTVSSRTAPRHGAAPGELEAELPPMDRLSRFLLEHGGQLAWPLVLPAAAAATGAVWLLVGLDEIPWQAVFALGPWYWLGSSADPSGPRWLAGPGLFGLLLSVLGAAWFLVPRLLG